MNLKETNTVLALVQAFDRRTVGEVDVRAWHSVLGDLEVADVMEAVRRHYADSSDWMMPAHVRRGVAEIVAERNRPEPSPWAPGQYGVLREDAVAIVEGQTGERLALSELPAAVADLVARVRAGLPESSREALRPRTVAWEREQAAYRRSQGGEPNPHYRPKVSEHAVVDPDAVEALRESDGFCSGGASCTHAHRESDARCCSDPSCRCEPGECVCKMPGTCPGVA
jgi:hypothetical protein